MPLHITVSPYDEIVDFSVTGCPPGCSSCHIADTTSGTANELVCSVKPASVPAVPDCLSGYTANPDGSMSCISKLITHPLCLGLLKPV